MNRKGVACGRCRSGRLALKRIANCRFRIEECDRCGSVFVRLLDRDCGGLA
jgi:hypothetical protein